MSFWIFLAFLVLGLGATGGTRWLAACIWQAQHKQPLWWTTIVADLIWAGLMFGAAVVARRYIERIGTPAAGYTVLILGIIGLSLLRAFLYQSALNQRPVQPAPDIRKILEATLQNLAYLLFALVLYLIISWLTNRPAQPSLFIPLFIGALLPDLDSRTSWLGRLLPFLSRWLEAHLGACQKWHSLVANALVAAILTPLIPIFGISAWGLIGLGFLAHLLVDLLSPQGILLFWPVSHTRYVLFPGFVDAPAGSGQRRLVAGLALVAIVLLLSVDVGPPPDATVAPSTYEQSLQTYLSLRGKTLAFADVDGTWQATGRRVAARFEILNAAGDSLVMLDRYTGWVFTAGHAASDNLYLNRITVLQGSGANIKPVEVQLHNQSIGEALPTIYEMQPEPGLQHIFVAGDIILPADTPNEPLLQPDYSQTQMRRIVSEGGGHYRLQYLTASDLVALSDIQVETADLVIVATYSSSPASPTATPLPEAPGFGVGP